MPEKIIPNIEEEINSILDEVQVITSKLTSSFSTGPMVSGCKESILALRDLEITTTTLWFSWHTFLIHSSLEEKGTLPERIKTITDKYRKRQ